MLKTCECNMCDNMCEEKNPVRIGFETRYICDDCLNKLKAIFQEVRSKNEDNDTGDAD